MLKPVILLMVVVGGLILVVLMRTLLISTRSHDVETCAPHEGYFVNASKEIINRFQQSLHFKTISRDVHDYNTAELTNYIQFIKSAYPLIHTSSEIRHEVVSDFSLLYTWPGTDDSLQPYMIAGHLDVVPVDRDQWEFSPFAAEIHDDYIYARGTIDAKQIVMGALEAVEYLLSIGFKPQRTLYIAFGHDEEVSGHDGAAMIGKLLKSRSVHNLAFIIDEGLTVTNGFIPGIDRPVALVGSSEKGYLTLNLTVRGDTGHSSMPTEDNSIIILADALSKLTRSCHPSMLGYGPEKETFEHLAPVMRLPQRIAMSNLWLFSPIVSWVFSRKPSSNAIIRTVTSVTKISGGVKDNVLPPTASAIVNHRIHPAQTVAEVIEYDRQLIGDDRVNISIKSATEPHPMSPTGINDFGYQTIKNTIRQIWTNAAVAPGTMIGNTDTRHYLDLSKAIYRFSPTVMFLGDEKRFHGNNERISIKNYEQAINFYVHLIKNADKSLLPKIHEHQEEL